MTGTSRPTLTGQTCRSRRSAWGWRWRLRSSSSTTNGLHRPQS